MTAVPTARALTTPEGDTVAMSGSLVVNETALFVAVAGDTVSTNDRELPTTTEEFRGATVTPVTGTMLRPLFPPMRQQLQDADRHDPSRICR